MGEFNHDKAQTAAAFLQVAQNAQMNSNMKKLGENLQKESAKQLEQAKEHSKKMQEAANLAFEKSPDKQPIKWQNPNNGHNGATVPTKTYYNDLGAPCREYETSVIIGGKKESAYGTACRQFDGSWKIKQ